MALHARRAPHPREAVVPPIGQRTEPRVTPRRFGQHEQRLLRKARIPLRLGQLREAEQAIRDQWALLFHRGLDLDAYACREARGFWQMGHRDLAQVQLRWWLDGRSESRAHSAAIRMIWAIWRWNERSYREAGAVLAQVPIGGPSTKRHRFLSPPPAEDVEEADIPSGNLVPIEGVQRGRTMT